MGETESQPDDADPDAIWRPGFPGSVAPTPARPVPALADGVADEPDRALWSREGHVTSADIADARPLVVTPDSTGVPPATRRGRNAGRSPVATPAPVSGAASRSAVTQWWVRGGIALLVVAVAAVVSVLVFVGDAAPVDARAPRLPETIAARWTSDFDRVIDAVAVTDGVVIVGAAGGLTAFDAVDGSQRWSRPQALGGRDVGVDRIVVIDELVLVQTPGGSGSEVRAFDLGTGTQLWELGGEGTYAFSDAVERPSVLRRGRVAGHNVVVAIDLETGVPIGEPQASSSVTAVGEDLGVEPSDRRVAIWSPVTQEIVAGPVDSFDLGAVAALDGAVVALDLDGRIAAYDAAGIRTDATLLTSQTGESARSNLLGVIESSSIAVVASETSLGFGVVEGEIVVEWERSGRISQLVAADRGHLGVLVEVDAGGLEIVDAETGETVARPASGRERLPLLARNGYLLAPALDDATRVVTAFDYDDRELWSVTLGQDAVYDLYDGAIAVVESTAERSRLTILR